MARPKMARAAAPQLVSQALPEVELIDVGVRYPTDRLVDLAVTVLAKIGSYDFATYGLDARWASAMSAQMDAIRAARDVKGRLAQDALPTADRLEQAIAAAKTWRRRALTALAILPGARKVAGAGTGSSAARLSASVQALMPAVRRAEGHGGGQAFAADGARLAGELDAARKEHKAAIGALSPEGRALNAAKGVLYEELRRAARVARTVAPAEASLFAVSTHLRVHRGRRAPPAGPGSAPAPTPAAARG